MGSIPAGMSGRGVSQASDLINWKVRFMDINGNNATYKLNSVTNSDATWWNF